MDSEFNFRADAVLRGKAYPALAEWTARPYTSEWREFVYHWPNTIPCELHEHCATHGFPYTISSNSGDFYTIGIGFFNFDVDYFALIPPAILESQTTILFYYHEGDNPHRIKQRLDALCDQHDLPITCYQFVSGNTAAEHITGFHWFPDHELLYWHRNRAVPASDINFKSRPYNFTILNRTHKWWRAAIMADLERSKILNHSLWSYNTNLSIGDNPADNPIEVDTLDLRTDIETFLQQGLHTCDDLTQEQHNDHHLHVHAHYSQSYCHIVIETHFDADQSGGAFLTEKTFKPIKHGQPFVIVGAPGSLQALRNLGYRTFDHAIDNSYDLETNNTCRWQKVLQAIKKINQCDLDSWFASCIDDLQHNQRLFVSSKFDRLSALYKDLINIKLC
jgi:hypothetical protein